MTSSFVSDPNSYPEGPPFFFVPSFALLVKSTVIFFPDGSQLNTEESIQHARYKVHSSNDNLASEGPHSKPAHNETDPVERELLGSPKHIN